jgi:hypothetical protein
VKNLFSTKISLAPGNDPEREQFLIFSRNRKVQVAQTVIANSGFGVSVEIGLGRGYCSLMAWRGMHGLILHVGAVRWMARLAVGEWETMAELKFLEITRFWVMGSDSMLFVILRHVLLGWCYISLHGTATYGQ